MASDNERREVARNLRELVGYDFVDAFDLAKALRLEAVSRTEYDSWSVNELADLIDPDGTGLWQLGFDEGFASADDWYAEHTDEELARFGLKRIDTCRFLPVAGGGYGCDGCFTWFQEIKSVPKFCPQCGA